MSQYKSKVEIVYEQLMEDIVNGVYKQGARLVISQLSKQYHVSDIPVREALRNLESEGYVRINANQGAVVCGFDKEMLTQVFQIKGVLEGYASRVSIDYITPRDIKKIRSINEQLRKALESQNVKKYSQLNIQFHLEIYQCIPNKELYNMICDLWKKWGVTKSVFKLDPARIESSIAEHEQIIRLIEEKKYDELEFYVRNHKFKSGYALIQKLEPLGE